MIETSIFNALKALVSNRCYPLQMPENPTYPAIVYSRIAGTPFNVLDTSASIDQVRMQVDCYALTYDGAKTLSDSVRGAMESAAFKGTLQFDTDLYESEVKVYRVVMDFYVWQKNI
jgi:hypothetical protein